MQEKETQSRCTYISSAFAYLIVRHLNSIFLRQSEQFVIGPTQQVCRQPVQQMAAAENDSKSSVTDIATSSGGDDGKGSLEQPPRQNPVSGDEKRSRSMKEKMDSDDDALIDLDVPCRPNTVCPVHKLEMVKITPLLSSKIELMIKQIKVRALSFCPLRLLSVRRGNY